MDVEQLRDSSIANLKSVFSRTLRVQDIAGELIGAFIDILLNGPIPDGLRNPMASGAKRGVASRRNVETLLANIVTLLASKKKTLAISLNRNTYSNTRLTAGFIDLVKLAAHESRDLLILKKGFQDVKHPRNSRLSRIKPTRRLKNLIGTRLGGDDVVGEQLDLIILRAKKRRGQRVGDLIPRSKWEKDNTAETAALLRRVEATLRRFNSRMSLVAVTYKRAADNQKHRLRPRLHATYTGNFEHNGRFYSLRGGHQSLAKAERATICFDGQPTVELDYGGLHVRMLYHLAGDDYPLSSDPYGDVLEPMGKNSRRLFARFPGLRGDLKTTLLALLMGRKASAKVEIDRASFRLFRSWIKFTGAARATERDRCNQRAQTWAKAGLLDSSPSPSAALVLRAIRKAHAPIARYFSSAISLKLQHLDAKIACNVLVELMRDDRAESIPCLPMHDSFIVAREHSGALRRAMEIAYQQVMEQETGSKRSFKIPIVSQDTATSY